MHTENQIEGGHTRTDLEERARNFGLAFRKAYIAEFHCKPDFLISGCWDAALYQVDQLYFDRTKGKEYCQFREAFCAAYFEG